MKKIAVIGANEFQNPLILKAKEMGYETHVFAWADGAVGECTADYFYPISIVEKDEILKRCREIGIDLVASIGSDLAVHTVNYIARAIGLPCNSQETDLIATNKYLMRQAFERAGIPTPHYTEATAVKPLSLDGFNYPLIVKPVDRSGSRGIFKISNRRELEKAVEEACRQSFVKRAIVEEFIEGPEYSCESISWDGKHRILAFTKKYTTGSPHFIETGHDQPADIEPELLPGIETAMFTALDALGIRWGAAHAEFRITPAGQVRLIEVGPRMGGDCIGSDLVPLSTGYDFVRMVIDTAKGKAPDFTPMHRPSKAKIRFIMGQKDLDELARIKVEAPQTIWRVSAIESVGGHSVVDSATRFGYYILHD